MFTKEFIIEKLKYQLKNGNIVTKVILLNIALYLVFKLLNIFEFIFGISNNTVNDLFSNWLYIPSQFLEFIFKAYTLISYQFLHANLFHLLSNLVILHYFGNVFITLTHKKRFLPLYLLGGIFAGLFFLLVFSYLPSTNPITYLVGASGSAMAILAAVATLIPETEIYLFRSFKVKYKWIAFFFLGINLLTITAPNNIGNYAHIGGLLFGFIFIKLMNQGTDLSKPVNTILNTFYNFFTNKKELKVTHINKKFDGKKQFKSKSSEKENQKKIDAILDKISQHGYEKLSKAEKDFLFQNSKK